MESTLLIIKPDAVRRGLVGQILARFEAKGLLVYALRMAELTEGEIYRLYQEHAQKPWFHANAEFMQSGPVVLVWLRGTDAVSIVRRMIGVSNCREAAVGTIRGDLGMSQRNNLVHASADPAAAQRELSIFWAYPGPISCSASEFRPNLYATVDGLPFS